MIQLSPILKPKLIKAKADPNPNLSQSQRRTKAMGMGIMGIDKAVGLHWLPLWSLSKIIYQIPKVTKWCQLCFSPFKKYVKNFCSWKIMLFVFSF